MRIVLGSPTRNAFAIAPGFLDPRFSFTRTHTPFDGQLYVTGSDGVTLVPVAQNAVAYQGTQRELRVNPQFTNGIRSILMEGAVVGVVGSGGALPTNMSWVPQATQTLTVASVGVVNGLPAIELELSGTALATAAINFEAVGGVSLLASSPYAFAVETAITGGSLTNVDLIGIRGRIDATTAANGGLAGTWDSTLRTQVATITTSADTVSGRAQFLWRNTGVATTRLIFVAPRMSFGTTAPLIATPPIGSPQAQTIGASLLSTPLSSWPSLANGFFVYGTVRFLATTGNAQTIFSISDGSTSRDRIIALSNGNVTIGRPGLDSGALSTISPGNVQRWGLWGDAAGNLRGTFNGSAVVGITGAPAPSTFTTVLFGADALSTSIAFATLPRVSGVLPYFPSDAEALARINALPLT